MEKDEALEKERVAGKDEELEQEQDSEKDEALEKEKVAGKDEVWELGLEKALGLAQMEYLSVLLLESF